MVAVMARDRLGRFVEGNCGGPGRPKRPIEREYLGVLNEACSLTDWQAICFKAVQLAKEGDKPARDWLTHLLLGPTPPTPTQLAAGEVVGHDRGMDIAREVARTADDLLKGGSVPQLQLRDEGIDLVCKLITLLKLLKDAGSSPTDSPSRAGA
jgi:hypothetical protein